MPPILVANNISKTFRIPSEKKDTLRENLFGFFGRNNFNYFNVLEDISFNVEAGEWLGIVGPNGSGKSTLLKIIAQIYLPDTGHVEIHGKLVPFLELGVGFNPELSARDNIFLNGVLLGMSVREVKDNFDEIVSYAGIGKFLDTKLKNYSSGMQVRLAFSIASLVEADIYLLDEILAVGDAEFTEKSKERFKEFKRAGKTVIFVSHDLPAVDEWCDRAIWIEKGRIARKGETRMVTNAYWRHRLQREKQNKKLTAAEKTA